MYAAHRLMRAVTEETSSVCVYACVCVRDGVCDGVRACSVHVCSCTLLRLCVSPGL